MILNYPTTIKLRKKTIKINKLKWLRYIHYFIYIDFNWGFKIAAVLFYQEIKGESKYNINTTGIDDLKSLKKNGIDISHATIYMPVSYAIIENSFEQIPLSGKKHFLDIGCGKGRAMCVAAHYGFSKISGIDFSSKLCEAAVTNLNITQQKFAELNYTLINEDAAIVPIPFDVDCIFLFNPFDKIVMQQIVINIQQSLLLKPRQLYVIYVNPLLKNIFLEEKFSEVYYSKTLEYFELSILKNRP